MDVPLFIYAYIDAPAFKFFFTFQHSSHTHLLWPPLPIIAITPFQYKRFLDICSSYGWWLLPYTHYHYLVNASSSHIQRVKENAAVLGENTGHSNHVRTKALWTIFHNLISRLIAYIGCIFKMCLTEWHTLQYIAYSKNSIYIAARVASYEAYKWN